MAINYERVTVTPGLAKKWLDRNIEVNRRPKDGKIVAYARDMASGAWNPDSGETIKFDVEGSLIDGQNRLAAVVLAEVSIDFDVATGLPVSAMQVIDTGAARSAADVLKIAGATDRMRAGSIVRWSILWDAQVYMGKGGRLNPTTTEILQRYLAEPGRYNSAASRATDCQNRGLGTGSAAGIAHYLFSGIDSEQTHQFFDQYISGANLPDRSAVLVLRNRIAKARVDRITKSEQLALFIRAWNAFRAGKPIDALLIARGDLTNVNFPQPK